MKKQTRFWLMTSVTFGMAVSMTASGDVHDVAQVTNRIATGDVEAFDGTAWRTERTVNVKTGGGTLIVQTEDSRVPALDLQAREGTVEYKDETAAPAPADLSDAVKSKLALWVSAKDETHIVRTGDAVEFWYDVRETDMGTPCYAYLKTECLEGGALPTLLTAQYVTRSGTCTEEQRAVWFHGYGSGAAMNFKNPDGSAFGGRPKEFSTVYGYINNDQAIGYLFGNSIATGGNVLYYCQENGLPWQSAWAPVAGDTRLWLDGKVIDRSIGLLPRGFHAFHMRVNTLNDNATPDGVFNLALFSQSETIWGRGGEYLSEVMVFTNRLTHAERFEVQRYMSLKWFADRRATMGVTLESGAELDVSVAVDEPLEADLRVTGEGAFVKKGDGTLVYCPKDLKSVPSGAVTLEGGAVEARRAIAVAAEAGQKITAALPSELVGETMSVGAASAADVIEKDGPGTATIAAIPSDVKTLSVSEGTLVVRPVKAVKRYEVAIPNGNFEDWGGDTSGNIAANFGGWSCTGSAVFYNRERWRETGTGTALPYPMSTFGLADLPVHPEGGCGLMLRIAGSDWAKVDVDFPEAGEYELSYMICGGHYSARIHNYLTDAADGEFYIGESAYFNDHKTEWEQRTFRFSIAEVGTYTLHFDLDEHLYEGSPMDEATTITSLHLYRVGDKSLAYKIPGGDFERLESHDSGWTYLPGISYVDMNNTVAGWTFDATLAGGYPRSGLVDLNTMADPGRRWGNGFNCSHRPFGGAYQLLIRANGGTAQVTFTPPAGKWYLQATMAYWGDYSGDPQIAATAGATSLGSLKIPSNWTMTPRTWPESFVADGETGVTLTLAYSGPDGTSGVHLDDFELVPEYHYDEELVKNGDFEKDRWQAHPYNGWTYFGDCTTYPGYSRTYGVNEEGEWGFDHASGNYFVEPYYSPDGESACPGGFYQDITFPNRGWYRLSYLTKGRVWASHTSYPVDTLLIDVENSSTNLIDRFERLPRGTFCQQTALFHVDEACVRRLLFVVREPSYDRPAFDDISIRYVGENGEGGVSNQNGDIRELRVKIAEGACLKLDYAGTNVIRRLTVNGVRYPYGVVNSANCPQILGPGSLLLEPSGRGAMILVR